MSLNEAIQRILLQTNYKANPYFEALAAKNFDKEDFVETQVQFFFAVVFFARPMAALAGKIPTPEKRLEILRNVWEEHGEGNLSSSHGRTFLILLERLAGLTSSDVDKRTLWPEVRQFNTTLAGVAVLDEYLTGVGCIGMIERMFSEISGWIGLGIVANGWLDEKRLVHYQLHEQLDIKHSQDFFDILEPHWQKDAEERYHIEQGLLLGASMFNQLYGGLYAGRKRRWFRDITGPHTRAAGL